MSTITNKLNSVKSLIKKAIPQSQNKEFAKEKMTLKEAYDLFLARKCEDNPFQANLPAEKKNSMKRFDILRFDSNTPNIKPKILSYYLDLKTVGPMYLDALLKIKDEIDPTLSFRRSCREGICGSCSMTLDGRHHLACISSYPRNLEPSLITPLEFCSLLKDLVVDMTTFYNHYKMIDPFLKKKRAKVFI